MFQTRTQDMLGRPGMFAKGVTQWHSISRALRTHWFHAVVRERLEEKFVSTVRFLGDETALNELLGEQGNELEVEAVQVMTPPWMNKSEAWRFEKLTSVVLGDGQYGTVVCLLEVEGGAVYADVHDKAFDPSSVGNRRTIYPRSDRPRKT